jgi:hypothetical protein
MPAKSKPSGAAQPSFMDPALMPWVLVSEIYWMSYKLLERRFYELGVSASQARVITVLHYSPKPIKPSTVATLLFQETQSITGILHRIEARGWVTRSPEAVVEISAELYDELFVSAMTAAERRQVEAGLRKIRAKGFTMPETDFKLRRAQQFGIWRD